MAIRNESVHRQSVVDFKLAIDHMARNVAEQLRADEALPDLRITSGQFAAGRWAFPEEYHPIIEHAMAQVIVHQKYELSGAQLHLACIDGVAQAGKLWIDGILQEDPSKKRPRLIQSRRSSLRVCTSIRRSTKK